MIRRSIAVLLVFAVIGIAVPARVLASESGPGHDQGHSFAGFTFPINAVSDTQGSFTGTLRVFRFGVEDGKLMAAGLLTGTRTDAAGVVTAIVRTVSIPVALNGGTTAASGPAAPASCGVLHLELGPLDLDLLGLVVHLDRVVLDISAVPGAGNLLGNLLCSITGLLDGGGALHQVANLLNQLLSLLG